MKQAFRHDFLNSSVLSGRGEMADLHGSGTLSASCSFLGSSAFFWRGPFHSPSLPSSSWVRLCRDLCQVDSAVRALGTGIEPEHVWLEQPCALFASVFVPPFWNGSPSSYMTHGLNLGIRFGDIWMICFCALLFLHQFKFIYIIQIHMYPTI